MKQYKNIMAQLPGNAEDMGTCGGIQSTGFLFPTMKPLNDVNGKNDVKSQSAEAPKAEPERIDFSMVKIEPLFADDVEIGRAHV